MTRSFPHYLQLDAMDCGPSCLRIIAKYYGRTYSLQILREKSFITRERVNMLGISDAAENIGFPVQEVLGAVPHWILRWGVTIIALVVLILLIGSWFFKYPDTIQATMILTGNTPPADIVSKTSGHLKELNISDGQVVNEGDFLGVIENSASTGDMLLLKRQIETLIAHPDSTVYFPYSELKLGSVQGLYVSFLRSLNNYRQFIELDYYTKKIASIQNRIQQYEQYYRGIEGHDKITKQQHELAQSQFKRDSLLKKKDVLSDQEMDNATNLFLQSRLSVKNSSSSLENLRMQISQTKESLLDTEKQYMDNKNTLETELNTLSIQLLNEIKTWELNYALISPISGQVTFTAYWSENQQIAAGEAVFTVIPTNSTSLVGKALLPVARSGKVKAGQKVNVYFLNYPDEEFGMVRGKVKNISLVPVKDNYTVEVVFPEGLMTTYKRELPFSQEMTANVEIITEDLRLLERFFLPVKKIFKENF